MAKSGNRISAETRMGQVGQAKHNRTDIWGFEADAAGSEITERGPPHAVSEVAKRLHCSVATVRRRIAAGDLAALKHGRVLRVLEDDLQAFIRASRRWR